MKLGKLMPEELDSAVFKELKHRRVEVIEGAKSGRDCAALSLGNGIIYLTSDPITIGTPEVIGGLAVIVCCNDLAAAGAEPIGILLTLLLPAGADVSTVSTIMKGAEDAAREVNVEIVGGHTEFTGSVVRPIISATAIGTRKFFNKREIQKGDRIIITKSAAIEGTMLLAPLSKTLTAEEKNEAKRLRNSLSVLPEGLAVRDFHCVMHDITEGGVLGAVAEVLIESGLGARIDLRCVPLLAITEKICKEFELNPYHLISSGSMLIIAEPNVNIIESLVRKGIAAVDIGVVTGNSLIATDGKNEKAFTVQRDEICKAWR